MTENKKNLERQIVFFDGLCHLCNGFVDFAIQNETPQSPLVYAPLQGETAALYLEAADRQSLSSVIFWNKGRVVREAPAVLEILHFFRAPWPVLAWILSWLPESVSNWIYRWVARNRYAWFGQRDSCRLPLESERKKLWL